MHQDKKSREEIKDVSQQDRIRKTRIFQPYKQKNASSYFSQANKPGYQYILEEQDDIGPKVYCHACQAAYYEFQISDHLKQCMKLQLGLKNVSKWKLDQKKKPESQAIAIGKQIKRSQIFQDSYIQPRQEVAESEDKDPHNQQILNESLIELLKFQESINKISRIVNNKSSLDENKSVVDIMNQQIQQIPCPFCAKNLPLSQLDHIDKCQLSVECKHCREKYPLTLHEAHLMVCQLNPTKNSQLDSFSRPNRQSFRIFGRKNQRPIRQPLRPNIRFNFKNKDVRQPEAQKQRQRISAEQLEQQSRIRERNLKGLSKKELGQLVSQIYYDQKREEEKYCAICTFELEAGQSVNQLSCKHIFHKYCLLPWLQQRSTCPTCKSRVVK